MLFPPIELLSLASIAQKWHGMNVILLDAIAENKNLSEVKEKIAILKPGMIVSLTGFEIFEEDISNTKDLKQSFPDIHFVLFGHYATTFPLETFIHSGADYILEGEPDVNFSHLLDFIRGNISINDLFGVFYLDKDSSVKINHGQGRIKKPDILPIPAHELLQIALYSEPFLPKPFGLVQSARGCPYSCNFCVRSFGSRLALRTPESIITELETLIQVHKVRAIRFIDDTFTATSKRVIKLCKLMIEKELNLQWTCLSRADTLNEEMVMWMSKAGCTRVYIGIESGSPKILHLINKDIDLQETRQNILLLKKYNIETSAFFMVGHPEESEEDFEASIQFALECDFDFVMAFEFICYPGTAIFDQLREKIDFSIIPYKNKFIDKGIQETARKREKEFYKRFYFRKRYFLKSFKNLIKHPVEVISNASKSLAFQIHDNISERNRADYI